MFFSSLRLTAIAAVAALSAMPAAAQNTTTFLQFFEDSSSKQFQIERVAGVTTFTVVNLTVNAIALDFAPGAPTLYSDAVFNLTASSSGAVTQIGSAVSQSGYVGSLSFTTGGGLNLLSLDFDNGLTSSFLGADSGSFSSDSSVANINASSDIFDISQFVGGNFALSISGLTAPVVIEGDYSTVGNVTGTFAGTIPEPATWGLMIAGFGMVGFAARRRRVAHVAA